MVVVGCQSGHLRCNLQQSAVIGQRGAYEQQPFVEWLRTDLRLRMAGFAAVGAVSDFMKNLKLTSIQQQIGRLVLKEINARLGFLIEVGLDYLDMGYLKGLAEFDGLVRIHPNLMGVLFRTLS